MASGVVYAAVRTFLAANWTTTPIAFENEEKASNGTSIPPSPAVPWVDVEMTGTVYGQQSIGAGNQRDNRWDEEGLLFLHIMMPKGEGSSVPRGYAKTLADLLTGNTSVLAGLEFTDAHIGRGITSRLDGNWYGNTLSIEWRWVDATR